MVAEAESRDNHGVQETQAKQEWARSMHAEFTQEDSIIHSFFCLLNSFRRASHEADNCLKKTDENYCFHGTYPYYNGGNR